MILSSSRFFAPLRRPLVLAVACAAVVWSGVTPSQAQTATESEHQDWKVRCEERGDPPQRRCHMFQNVLLKQNKQRVLSVGITYPPDQSEPLAAIVVPLGIYLPSGIVFKVDDGEGIQIAIETCSQQGCHTRLQLSAALLESLRKGLAFSVTFKDFRRRELAVPASLKGFSAAFAKLKE